MNPGLLTSWDHKRGSCHSLPGSGSKSQSLAWGNLAFHKTATRGRESPAFLGRFGRRGSGTGGRWRGWSHSSLGPGPADMRAALRGPCKGAWEPREPRAGTCSPPLLAPIPPSSCSPSTSFHPSFSFQLGPHVSPEPSAALRSKSDPQAVSASVRLLRLPPPPGPAPPCP